MINVKDAKVQEVMQGMHEAVLRKTKRDGLIREGIVKESRIFSIICEDFDLGPMKIANIMNDKYGYEMTGDEVIQIFKNRRIGNPVERKEVFRWASNVANLFAKAVLGDKEQFEKFEKLRKEPSLRNGRKNDSQDRIAAIMIYQKYPEIDAFGDADSLHLLGDTLARYCFYDIADAICEVYGFPLYKEKKNQQPKGEGKKLSYEQALRRIERLENTLDRTNTMLQELQKEFDEQLEASKARELAAFFAKLNSEKYGCILDELLLIRKGVDELRRSNYELPIEINGLLIMVKKLIQFVRDSHIEPIMKIAAIREVVAAEVEFCNYEGTPFADPAEKKKVSVVSPGWIYRDKELQISRPKVKEEV